ncbi:MAG: Choline-sulfatase [uncultured Chloroflexi bacterium]|uniref:Choline-sulfatase n=1 Tax=uncultured Chloroflexota bacterium TaxID=166587 RepID=A0A6J4IAJ2_9CHLR|nr:MAG: Choline-sulfatase [uncultured Chloroflexota bacterium]
MGMGYRGAMQVILVSSDTLRADHLGCHGYFRPTSPRIDRFAAEGVDFVDHVSQAPYTLPSFTNLITGQFGTTHKVLANPSGQNQNFPVGVDDYTPMLADLFRASGPTIEMAHGRYVSGGTLTASFDNLVNFPNHPRWFVRGYEFHVNVTPGNQRMVGAEVLHRRLFPWLEQHAREDFFLFIHYWDVHGPYLAPAPHGEQYPHQKVGDSIPVYSAPGGQDYIRGWGPVSEVTPEARAKIDAYDGGINYFDHVFGQLLDHLDALGIGKQAVVALTADHGESMAEHRVPFAHDELYQATINTPLIIRAPAGSGPGGGLPAGRTVTALSQAVDIAPTMLDLAGLTEAAASPHFQGKSLVSLARGEVEQLHERSYSEWTRYLASRCIRTPRHKLIYKFTGGLALARRTPRRVAWHELYDLQADPDETRDLAAEQPNLVRQLDAELQEWVRSQLQPGEEDPLLRPEMACWEPGPRAGTGGALALLPPERNPWI